VEREIYMYIRINIQRFRTWKKREMRSELREMPAMDLFFRQNWTSFLKARKSKAEWSSEMQTVSKRSHGFVSSSMRRTCV